MERMKHCGTCRFWAPEGTPDEGICQNVTINGKTSSPPVGGLATYASVYTHAAFGCVNHKPIEIGLCRG